LNSVACLKQIAALILSERRYLLQSCAIMVGAGTSPLPVSLIRAIIKIRIDSALNIYKSFSRVRATGRDKPCPYSLSSGRTQSQICAEEPAQKTSERTRVLHLFHHPLLFSSSENLRKKRSYEVYTPDIFVRVVLVRRRRILSGRCQSGVISESAAIVTFEVENKRSRNTGFRGRHGG
jgi:hypothetical protein